MAGETIKTEAICLSITPWSKTSHVVSWLTPTGRVGTVVKGAVRPKSAFLGQYDLNYTCDILYYARAKGDLHALRECVPHRLREGLRDDFRALAFASYARMVVERLAPQGVECGAWYELLEGVLEGLLEACVGDGGVAAPWGVGRLVKFELDVLHLMGLSPEIEAESGGFVLRGEREIPVSREVAAYLRAGCPPRTDAQIPLDAARVIGVFYTFHVDLPPDVRRTVLGLMTRTNQKG